MNHSVGSTSTLPNYYGILFVGDGNGGGSAIYIKKHMALKFVAGDADYVELTNNTTLKYKLAVYGKPFLIYAFYLG